MTEQEIRAEVNKIIADNNLTAQIVECATSFEDYDYYRVVVQVDRKDYERAFSTDYGYNRDYHISWHQKVPELVGAEVGDFVLIFCDHYANDAESGVGLVSSKNTQEDDSVSYGCKYIKVGLNNNFVDKHYNFELTSEDYGGFQAGFLRVLTQQEIIDHLRVQLDVALKNELESVQKRFDDSIQVLPNLIGALSFSKKVKCEKLDIDLYLPFVHLIKK